MATAAVVWRGGEFLVTRDAPFRFGRADAEAVVSLDPIDMGISGAGWDGRVIGVYQRWSTQDLTGHPGEPLHLCAYGVVGLDAAKVELLWDTGRRVEATLGDQTIVAPVRRWIAGYETADPDQIVATDSAGGSWTIGKGQLVGQFGETGC